MKNPSELHRNLTANKKRTWEIIAATASLIAKNKNKTPSDEYSWNNKHNRSPKQKLWLSIQTQTKKHPRRPQRPRKGIPESDEKSSKSTLNAKTIKYKSQINIITIDYETTKI